MLTTSLAATALAQNNAGAPDPTTEEGKRAEGKSRYEQGVQAYQAGHYKDAIDLFLQADSLAPSAALSFNIARAYEKISDDASTLQWYRDFRRRAPDAKNGPDVDQRIHELEGILAAKGVQQLTILSKPLGATVVFDDQPVGVTPFTGQFPPGSHKVALRLRGYSDNEQNVDLPSDHARDLVVPLVPSRDRPPAGADEQPPAGTPGATPPGPGGATTGPGAGGTPAQPDRPSGPRFGPWPYIVLGAGGAVLGSALSFEFMRRSAEKDAKADDTQIAYKADFDKMQSRQSTARILGAVGGVLVATGGTLLVIDLASRHKASEHASLSLACLPGACGFDVQGRF